MSKDSPACLRLDLEYIFNERIVMNWTKFAYHSFLTIILGVTLSVCSNVMETDDFEIEAIANSSKINREVKLYHQV